MFYGYREKLKCSAEVNSASAKVLSRWLKTLVRHESAAPLCGDLGSAAQRAVPRLLPISTPNDEMLNSVA